ncbi:putative proton-dependent oligopeptide transporter family, MFS transporter superfamily [Helianthus annuus]|nr:putative proton-dependent oligopeptide transporter family, MFS transporter superfamily [Helianthus annuus]KAJ0882783.1 putative proton-dependent oligopeptide transporter family, MFS transporter superfamily [Helianthus annuus]
MKDHKQDQGDNCYKEDVKVIRSLLRIFPMWGTFFVVSLISTVGNTFYYEQFDNLEYSYKIPVQMYFVIQQFSYFTIPFLYQWTSFRRNQKLQIGVGVLCSFLSCIFAWLLEVNRVKELRNLGSKFFMLGCMEGLTVKGMLKFYVSQVDKPVQNYGEEYMEIVWCLGQLVNTSLMLILRRQLGWFNEGTNDETRLDMYYLVLVCFCSVNLIIYTFVATWFYKDKEQDHNSSHDDLHQHD